MCSRLGTALHAKRFAVVPFALPSSCLLPLAATMGRDSTFWNTHWSHLFESWVTTMQGLRNWQNAFAAAFDSTALRSVDCDDSSEVQDFSETDTTPHSPVGWTVLRRRLEATYHKGDENSQKDFDASDYVHNVAGLE